MSDKMRPTDNKRRVRSRRTDEGFPESPNEEERTVTVPDQQRHLDDVNSDSLPGPSRITTDSAPVLKTPNNRGRKRRADEAFPEEENEDGTAMATKRTRHLADVEPEPLPGPSGISPNIADSTPVPMEIAPNVHGRKRNAGKAFPEKKNEDGTATATKQARFVEPEPLPGPSGITQTQQNADVDFTPVLKAGKKALKKTDRGGKRRADEAFPEDEKDEDETAMATKRMRCLADVEPGFLFRHGEMPDDCDGEKNYAVSGPSGINPAALPVKRTSKRRQRVQRTGKVNPKDKEDEDTLPSFETRQRCLSSFLRVTPDKTFMSRYEVFPDDRIVHGRNTRIYSGIYKYDGREVVLKCVRVDMRFKRFTRHAAPGVFNEIVMMLEIQPFSTRCPNLMQMHDWYLCPDGYIVVLEKLSESWVTLDRFITESHAPLNERTCRVLIRQLVRAISHITERGVKHCTLVPEHTMINRDTLELKVISFGKCQHIHRDDEQLETEVDQIGPGGEQPREYAAVAAWSFMSTLRCFMKAVLNLHQVEPTQSRLLSSEFWQLYEMCSTYGSTLMEHLLELPWMAQDDWTYSDD